MSITKLMYMTLLFLSTCGLSYSFVSAFTGIKKKWRVDYILGTKNTTDHVKPERFGLGFLACLQFFCFQSSCDLALGYLSSPLFVAGLWGPCFCLLIPNWNPCQGFPIICCFTSKLSQGISSFVEFPQKRGFCIHPISSLSWTLWRSKSLGRVWPAFDARYSQIRGMNITLRLVEGKIRLSKYKSSIAVTVDLIHLVWCTFLLGKTMDNFQSSKNY